MDITNENIRHFLLINESHINFFSDSSCLLRVRVRSNIKELVLLSLRCLIRIFFMLLLFFENLKTVSVFSSIKSFNEKFFIILSILEIFRSN